MNGSPVTRLYILVVVDDPFVRETVEMLLRFDGHIVAEANSGSEALALFEPGKFDLVFTDYFMPAMKGDELAMAIKLRSPNQAVVMLTAYPEKLQSPEHRLTGVDILIGKPFELESLREAIIRFAPAHNSQGHLPQN